MPRAFTRFGSTWVAWSAIVVVVVVALGFGCASSRSNGIKGGLVPLDVEEAQLDLAHAGKRLALVVGINQFADPGWRPLRFAAKDADDLAHVLSDKDHGGFDVSTPHGATTTSRSALMSEVANLRQRNTSPDDVVVIYFSTHGTLARNPRGELKRYLVASDTRLDDVRNTGLELDELEKALDSLPSRRKVLILATCHSGAGKSLLPREVLKELEGTKAPFLAPPLEETSRASIVLAACDWGETAREDENLANDIYTHFLVEALLRPADRNGDGAVTATEAHDYARRRTYEFTHGQQRPSAQVLEVGADPVILSGHIDRLGRPELFGYEAALDGVFLRVDTDEPLTLPGALALPEGEHQVQLTKGDGTTLYSGELKLRAGERFDVGELANRPEPKIGIGVAGGYQGFLDRSASDTLVGPGVAAQLSVERADLITRNLAGRVDLSYAGGERAVKLVPDGPLAPFHYTGLQLGLSTPYQLRLGPVELEAGPRVGAVYVGRSFALDLYRSRQDYLVVSPGLTAGLALHLERRWYLFLRGDISAEVVVVDNQSRLLGFGGTWAGVGFRP